MKRFLALTLACGFGLAAIAPDRADASIIMTMKEVGGDVVLEGSGSANLAELDLDRNLFATWTINPANASIYTGGSDPGPTPGADNMFDAYGTISGPTSFGTTDSYIAATSSSHEDQFGVAGGFNWLLLPEGYLSGTELKGTATFENATFASLGLIEGTYTWNWGSGDNADWLTLQIGDTAAVPEPSTLALSGIALAGGLLAGWRRHRRVGKQV